MAEVEPGAGARGASFEVVIARDPGDVFAFVADLPQTPRWRTHLDEVSWLDDAPTAPGRRFRVRTTFAGTRDLELACEVTVWDPPRRFAYRVVDGPLTADNEYLVEPAEPGTRFVMTGAAGRAGRVARLFQPVLSRMYSRATSAEVERLRDLLENGRDHGGPAAW
jgi:uncharacterized membrane protein